MGESLLRRYGLGGRRAPLLAGVALVALLAVGALALGHGGCSGPAGGLGPCSGSSFAIERDGGPGEKSDGSGGSDAGSSSASGEASTRGRASGEGDSGGSDATGSATAKVSSVIVHVDGAVAAPGVYRLEAPHPRVDDAVRAAGGLTAEAETVSLNLAAPVADGQKVHVPAKGEAPVAATDGAGGGSAGTGTAADGAAGAAAGQSGGLVNINTADATALQALPGVGEATARAIVEDREKNGPFSAKEDIMRVSGIGEKKFERMRDSICV